MATKSKSMRGNYGNRKLASSAGRQKSKSGGEAKKPPHGPRTTRAGSEKQRKG
jgi:hypothetical protein